MQRILPKGIPWIDLAIVTVEVEGSAILNVIKSNLSWHISDVIGQIFALHAPLSDPVDWKYVEFSELCSPQLRTTRNMKNITKYLNWILVFNYLDTLYLLALSIMYTIFLNKVI